MKSITTLFLARNRACALQMTAFNRLFIGGEAKVTRENVLKATKNGLSFIWLYERLYLSRQLSKADAIKAIQEENHATAIREITEARNNNLVMANKILVSQFQARQAAAWRKYWATLARIRYRTLKKAKD